MSSIPTHLVLPFLASLLYVMGLLGVKKATSQGVSAFAVAFWANQWAAIAFSTLWLFGGHEISWHLLWQPLVIAVLYILGQVLTFSAIQHGDVSVAAPIFGVKILFVVGLLSAVLGQALPTGIWMAGCGAFVGIGLVQWAPTSQPRDKKRISISIAFALMAALAFALFDVSVQAWSPAWGVGRILPIAYWMVGGLSLLFLPYLNGDQIKNECRWPLLWGTILIASQALCIVFCLARFGDAARVNVVYTMRGVWSVLFAWLAASHWGGNEAAVPRLAMIVRLAGACLLVCSVLVVLFG